MRIETGLRRLEDFAFLEAHVRTEQVGKVQQAVGIRGRQHLDEAAQFGMVGEGARDQRMLAGLRQKQQDALLLDAKVRIEFDGKNLYHALRERRYLADRKSVV